MHLNDFYRESCFAEFFTEHLPFYKEQTAKFIVAIVSTKLFSDISGGAAQFERGINIHTSEAHICDFTIHGLVIEKC